MSIITCDTLIEGHRRDDVFAWLADPAHHEVLVRAGFPAVVTEAAGQFQIPFPFPGQGIKAEYAFDHADDSHGGRRVHVKLGGKRTRGVMHWSMRTMKPSTNTLVTLHADYTSGRVLGPILDVYVVRKVLEAGMKEMLEELRRQLGAGVAAGAE